MRLSEMSTASDAALEDRGGQLTREDRSNLFRFMAMMRAAEERGLALYKQGKVPGSFYDGCGQEAVSVGAAYALGPRDRMCILHRDLGAHFVRGITPDRYLANYMGRSGGVTAGKDGNMHSVTRASAASGWSRCCPTWRSRPSAWRWRSRCAASRVSR
jgi:pyruvate dehydrogenase E1 component alpha subunit